MAETTKTSISPMLSVRRGVKAIDFYKVAFGATELFRIGDEDNAVVAQMAVAGAEFWLADESPQYLNFSPESLRGSTVRMVMVVDDPDEVFTHAVAAGASVVSAVEDKEYGWRVGRVVDPFGHTGKLGNPYIEIYEPCSIG